ncbi:hypothetical protein ACOSQ2_017849 [Xanthoceras sorbifolium]
MDSNSSSSILRPKNMVSPLPNSPQLRLITKSMNFNLPIKLNSDNYIYWKALVLPAIRAIELEDFITRARVCPNKFIESTASNGVDKELIINPAFLEWRRFDQFLLGWLLTTVSESLIGQVTECMYALEAWRALESLFSQQSRAKVLQLKQQLQSLKKGSNTISEYFLKVKSIGNGLRAAGQAVSDCDLLLNVLNALGHDYDPVVVLVSQQHSISLLETRYMLLIHEQRIDHLNSAVHVDVSPSANFLSNNSSNTNNSSNRNNNRGDQNNGGRNSGNRGRRGLEDAGMGTTNQSVKYALVLATQLCNATANMTVLLLLKVTTIILLVQLIMVLCKFRLNRALSREIFLVINLAVVTTICRMVKVIFKLITIKPRLTLLLLKLLQIPPGIQTLVLPVM